jgi:hypothetical protein
MRSVRPISRAVILGMVACALFAVTPIATAGATDRADAARAQGRYYASFGQSAAPDAKITAARAQAAYYASFRHEEPLTPPKSRAGATAWMLPVAGLSVALLIAAGGTLQARRLRVRRRVAA